MSNETQKPLKSSQPPQKKPLSVEDSLETWGIATVLLGILSLIGLVVLSGYVNNQYSHHGWGSGGVSWPLIILGVALFLQGLFLRSILTAGVEVIRLLREIRNNSKNAVG